MISIILNGLDKKRIAAIGITKMLVIAIILFVTGYPSLGTERMSNNVKAHPANSKAGEVPVIFWVSDPVQPGEVVLAEGANWGDAPHIEIDWLQNAEKSQPTTAATMNVQKSAVITPLQVNASSVKFAVPIDWKPGVYSFRVESGGVRSEPVLVNAPDPWWQQGDWGKEASPGGWLRIFGKCLIINEKAKIVLKGPGKQVIIVPTRQDQWSLNVTLPSGMEAGVYETWVHNGCGGEVAWKKVGIVTVKEHLPLWKHDIFDVRDYGAIGNDIFEDTAPVQAALDAAGKNGGGIVYIPRGRFQINETLYVPRFVLIRGEGRDLSQLYWRDRETPLRMLIRGTNSFGIEDLSIMAFNHMNGIWADLGDNPDAGNVFLKRLYIRLNRFEQVQAGEAARRFPVGVSGIIAPENNAISLGGENVQVTDCDIFSSHGPYLFSGLRHALICNNRSFQGDMNYAMNGDRVIFENNEISGGCTARGGANYLQRTYFAHNKVGNMALADSELFTTDGGATAIVRFASVEGEKVSLSEDVNWDNWTQKGKRKVALFIMHGTGAGQYRLVKTFNGKEIQLEEPWTVTPDDQSRIILCPYFTRDLLIGNEFHDGAIVQSYCWGMEWIFAENKVSRVGGIHNAGRGNIPNWHTQYLGNEIQVGNGTRGPWNEQPSLDAHLEVRGDGARGTVFRRNVLHNNARIEVTQRVQDVVIDHNTIRDADAGIVVSEGSNGVLLWNNHFEKVKDPVPSTGENFFMHPAERLLTRLAADGLVSENLKVAQEWQNIQRKLVLLLSKEVDSPTLTDDVRLCQLKMLKEASSVLSSDVPWPLFCALTGTSLVEKSSPGMQQILGRATGGTGEISLTASLPSWSAPVNLSLGITDWQSNKSELLRLKPGKGSSAIIQLRIPEGVWGKPTIPFTCSAEGEDWKLTSKGKIQIGNLTSVSPDMVSQWMVIGPFMSDKPGEIGDKVYPSEKRLNIHADYSGADGTIRWQPVELTTENNLDFNQLLGSREKGVAYAVTVLRVAKPTTVAITTNGGSAYLAGITYLDGELLGVPFRYGNLHVSRKLSAGDHVLLCGVARKGNTWQLGVQVTVDPAANPRDVKIVPVEKFGEVAAIAPPAGVSVPEGKELSFSDGYNWKLVYDDDFNRTRPGKDWIEYEPQEWFEGKSWHLEKGHLASRGASYWEYISYAQRVTPPVRVECDLTGDPERLDDWFQAITLTPRNQVGGRMLWGNVAGAGYMLAPGWNRNPTSAALWRNEKEVLTNRQSPVLGAGRTRHIVAQFSPKRILLVVDGVVSLDYKDEEWLRGLDTVSLMNGFGRDWFDNIRIYEAKP